MAKKNQEEKAEGDQNQEPDHFIVVQFHGENSAGFDIDPKGITAFQLYALAGYLRNVADDILNQDRFQVRVQQTQAKQEILGIQQALQQGGGKVDPRQGLGLVVPKK